MYGLTPGNVLTAADGEQAYTQADFGGSRETWITLPREQWRESWKGKFTCPMVKLKKALYGHPDSGGFWEIHCENA